jgi:hypothetical protein
VDEEKGGEAAQEKQPDAIIETTQHMLFLDGLATLSRSPHSISLIQCDQKKSEAVGSPLHRSNCQLYVSLFGKRLK